MTKWTTKNIMEHPLTQNADVKEAFAEYVKMRKLNRKKLTEYAELLLWLELVKLAGEKVELAIAIVNKSNKKNWLDFYQLNDGGNYGRQTPPPSKQIKLL